MSNPNLDIKAEILISPFDPEVKITRFKSINNPELNLFSATEVGNYLGYRDLQSALKTSDCIPNKDYIVLEKDNLHADIWKQFEQHGFVTKFSPRTTILYESGYWKLLLKCRLKNGVNFRNWICSEVLPSISATGTFDLSLKNLELNTTTYIIKDTITNIYKIGKTTDLQKRLGTLKTSNLNLELILEIDKNCESQLHQRFKNKLIEGEWFALTEKDVEELKKENDRVIQYNFDNCVQVTSKTPASIKKAYGRPDKSAKEILRKTNPECAMTMTMNDYLVEKFNLELEQLKETDVFLTKTFEALGKLGITLNIQ